MATEIRLTRTLTGLVAADDEAREALKAWKVGQALKASVVIPRDTSRLRYFWELCTIISENSERWPTKEAAANTLKLGCGVFEEVQVKGSNGDWFVVRAPGSISFAKMSESEFRAFLLKAENYAATEMLYCEPEALVDALQQFMLGGRRAA